MTKKNLMSQLQKAFQLSPQEAKNILNTLFEKWFEICLSPQTLEIRQLGTWQWRYLPPKKGKIPSKTHSFLIKPRYKWHFKPSASLIRKLNSASGRESLSKTTSDCAKTKRNSR